MKIAIVASSVPTAGKRPVIPQEVGFTKTSRGLALKFANTGFVVFKEKLAIAEDILAVAPIAEDVLRPYALSAIAALNGQHTMSPSLISFVGRTIIDGFAPKAFDLDRKTALSGCAIVYQNRKGAHVTLLLCGLLRDIVNLIRTIPTDRYSDALPPPFSVENLRKVAAETNKPITFDY